MVVACPTLLGCVTHYHGLDVFSMPSLGRILVSDLVITDLFMHSPHAFTSRYDSTLLGCTYLHQRCFCMYFCKVNNNCYKQQIKTHGSKSRGQQEAACMCIFCPCDHYSELFTRMANLNFESALTQLP